MTTTTTTLPMPFFRGDKLEVATIVALVGFLAASQLSVAPAYIMLAITFACWAAVVSVHHERVQVPTMFQTRSLRHALDASFVLIGIFVMVQFVRAAQRVEPFTAVD